MGPLWANVLYVLLGAGIAVAFRAWRFSWRNIVVLSLLSGSAGYVLASALKLGLIDG